MTKAEIRDCLEEIIKEEKEAIKIKLLKILENWQYGDLDCSFDELLDKIEKI